MVYVQRLLENFLAETIDTRPLVYLNGMRQCGKSTLVQNLSVKNELNYISFDNPASLVFARNDPAGFIEQLPVEKLNIIDEVQLAPELFRQFKIAVDRKRLAGKDRALYVLTGSANIFVEPVSTYRARSLPAKRFLSTAILKWRNNSGASWTSSITLSLS